MSLSYASRFVFILCLMFVFSNVVWACDSCSITRTGRDDQAALASSDGRWFTNYLYEHQNWHEKEAGEGHALHHQGHDFHDKTSEDFHHVTIGNRLNDRFSVSLEVPYVIRHALEVDDHSILGVKQKSQGLGDLQLLGDWRVLSDDKTSLSLIGGVKFPTGDVKEANSAGDRFEQEMQPGSGSYDYVAGGAYRAAAGRTKWAANLIYVLKTEGAQDYRFGDLLSTSIVADYLLNPRSDGLKARLGLDANFQYEQKHEDGGETVKDSGGTFLFLGPTFTIEPRQNIGLNATFMLPVAQNPGGVHQTYDYLWTLGAKIGW